MKALENSVRFRCPTRVSLICSINDAVMLGHPESPPDSGTEGTFAKNRNCLHSAWIKKDSHLLGDLHAV